MSTDHAVDIDAHVRTYIAVFVALLALTIVTVAVSYLDLPIGTAVVVALSVAAVKGTLVACYFMHLVAEKKFIYLVLAVTAVCFLVLLAVPIITHSNGYWIHE